MRRKRRRPSVIETYRKHFYAIVTRVIYIQQWFNASFPQREWGDLYFDSGIKYWHEPPCPWSPFCLVAFHSYTLEENRKIERLWRSFLGYSVRFCIRIFDLQCPWSPFCLVAFHSYTMEKNRKIACLWLGFFYGGGLFYFIFIFLGGLFCTFCITIFDLQHPCSLLCSAAWK